MAITVTVEQKKYKEISFPCLMKWCGNGGEVIVLFVSEMQGTIVAHPHEESDQYLGEYKSTWISCTDSRWEPSPPITLSNA